MKLDDIVDSLVIDPRKLTEYALNPDRERGKHKAILFEKILGFTIMNYQDLLRQLETKCIEADAVFRSENEYGKRYQVDILINGVDGKQATVRTGWIILPQSATAYLTSLYVLRR